MDITEPTLLLNEEICKTNINRMVKKTQYYDLKFKPHMKTHQSAEIGEWLRNANVEAITVSSVTMAEYFSKHGWNNITIAFPCNTRQIDRINQLAAEASLTLLVNSPLTSNIIDKNLTHKVKAYIEIDTGSGRTGLAIHQEEEIGTLIKTLTNSQHLEWIGFYSHPGHSYNATSEKEIRQIHQSVLSQIQKLRKQFTSAFGTFEVCIGDTPCCSKANNFDGIDAISPGNFLFYDLMQHQIGSCQISDLAVAMACPIVDKYPERKELAVYGGAIHFSKENLQTNDGTHYGMVASIDKKHWEIIDSKSYLKALSQEHGLIRCSDQVFDRYQVGDLITILPIHSCLTANLMGSYRLEDDRIINQLCIQK
jgi:D-serine deaminase-like pyridoxal phosphate-dependent protein